jgi:hypothetical protein
VVQAAITNKVPVGSSRAVLLIPRSDYQCADSCENRCPRAHRTRLDGDEEGAISQAPVATALSSGTQGQDLCMGGWIAVDLPPIRCHAEHLSVTIHDHGTDGDVASFASGPRLN